MKIYLIGLPGVGKTFIGELLAKRLNITFIDLDAIIEEKAKISINSFFKTLGEEEFRFKESQELNTLIDAKDHFVLSLGGGSPCFRSNIIKLKSTGLVIWLKAEINTIMFNLKREKKNNRPLLHKQTEEEQIESLKKLYNKRKQYYKQAHMHYNIKNNIDSIERTIEDLQNKILSYSRNSKINISNREKIYRYAYKSPIGVLQIETTERSVKTLKFVECDNNITNLSRQKYPCILKECVQQLEEYFEGKRRKFNLQLLINGTDFQTQVWNALLKIPFGTTLSYQEIAQQINSGKAYRAVGLANSKNPISIIIPCHRVINKSGQLSGYAFGVNKKQWLINHEQKHLL